MENNIKTQLKEAKKLYSSKKYDESLELYDEIYNENSDNFNKIDLISYCWAIYQVHIKNFIDEFKLFESVEFITDLIPQADLNQVNTCPYTFSVFKVLDFLYSEKEYYNLFQWFEKINPELLDENRSNFKGRVIRSRREKFYDYITKSALECAEWELCIEMSKQALDSLKTFTNNSNIWYYWRIAKSLKELNNNDEALEYLKKVFEVKKDWFVFKEIAENYYILNENEKAINCICGAILTNDPIKIKVNLFYLAYNLLKDENYEMALKHAELYYLLKLDTGAEISQDIEDLEINVDELDEKRLYDEIKQYWQDFKFQNQKLHYGSVIKYIEEKNFGFILDENNESIFFHKNEFDGDNIYVGQLVSFYTEKSFDKSKNKESIKAVNIRGE